MKKYNRKISVLLLLIMLLSLFSTNVLANSDETDAEEKPSGTIKDITLVGGKATLTENIEKILKGFDVDRLSGKDRYHTSV